MKTRTCVVDASHSVDTHPFQKRGTDIYRCTDCGCIMADVRFDPTQYESSAYYTMIHKTVRDIDEEWGFRWNHILGGIRAAGGGPTLLDVGAGNGYFVRMASQRFGMQASGIEISGSEIRFAREIVGVELIDGRIEEHDRVYDVVTCFNVIEHVADPLSFLSAVVAAIKPGGLLALTTPNPGCIHARIRGLRKWNMVDPPHHINLFARESLVDLLHREQLQPVRYETLSTYINFVRNIDTRNLLLRRLFFHLLRLGNLGADHFFIAKKAGRLSA